MLARLFKLFSPEPVGTFLCAAAAFQAAPGDDSCRTQLCDAAYALARVKRDNAPLQAALNNHTADALAVDLGSGIRMASAVMEGVGPGHATRLAILSTVHAATAKAEPAGVLDAIESAAPYLRDPALKAMVKETWRTLVAALPADEAHRRATNLVENHQRLELDLIHLSLLSPYSMGPITLSPPLSENIIVNAAYDVLKTRGQYIVAPQPAQP